MIKKSLLLLTTLGYLGARYTILKTFKRYDTRLHPVVLDLPHRKLSFKSRNNLLVGNVFGTNQKGLVVFVHGLGLGSDDYYPIVKGLVFKGYQVLAYDSTGTFRSQGKNTGGINQSLVDLRACLKYVINESGLDTSTLFLVGHSWGAYATTSILNENFPIDGVVSLASGNSTWEMLSDNVTNKLERALLPLGMFYHVVTFGFDAFKTSVKGINKSNIPVLIVHGVDDDIVKIDTISLVAHKDDIKNPQVEYFIRHDRGHNSIFENSDNLSEMDGVLLDRIDEFFTKIIDK